ncbi:MAG: hypothetical protein EKK53_05795 [Burkholderiales bacterium]|jgi:hypothetical protein|nr:MAG: hypothetical protein EKK53_05795 [Burkholderiales bacterium]
MKSWLRVATTLALVGGLAGCLVPESFKASVDVHPDGAYTYRYDGTATHVLAAMQIKQKGPLSTKDEDAMKAEAAKGAKSPGVKKMAYLGAGRFELSTEQELRPEAGNASQIMKMISVRKDKDGSYIASSAEIKAKDLSELKSLGIKIEGTLQVTLPSGAQVLAHNADSTPGLFNKAYVWKIGGPDARPMLRYRLP